MDDHTWGGFLIAVLMIGLGTLLLLNYSIMPVADQDSIHSFVRILAPLVAAQPGVVLAGWAIHAYRCATLHPDGVRPSRLTASVIVAVGLTTAGLGMWAGEHHLAHGVVRGLQFFADLA